MPLAIASPRRRCPRRTRSPGSSTGRFSLRLSRRSRWTASRPRVTRSARRLLERELLRGGKLRDRVAVAQRGREQPVVSPRVGREVGEAAQIALVLVAQQLPVRPQQIQRGLDRPAALAVAVGPPVDALPVGPEVVAQLLQGDRTQRLVREQVHDDVVRTGGEGPTLGEGHEAAAEDGPEHAVKLPLGRPGELGQVGEGEPAPGRGDVAEERFLELPSVELLHQLVGGRQLDVARER